MAIAAMLEASPSPSDEQLAALPNICRCGAYPRIRRAIARAAAAAPPAAPAPERTEAKRLSPTSSAEEQPPR
jgi:isoquinoline 1-oxidoreductase alpha subunit